MLGHAPLGRWSASGIDRFWFSSLFPMRGDLSDHFARGESGQSGAAFLVIPANDDNFSVTFLQPH